MTLVEVCVDTLVGAIDACSLGAARLEFCAQLELDGLTPTEADLRAVVASVHVPVFAMIRPRAGSFVMSQAEVRVMAGEIAMARNAGAAGVVLGVLSSSGEIDQPSLAALVAAADELPVTYHRAFDGIAAPFQALDVLVRHGVTRLLTAGDGPRAWEGRELLRGLIERAGESLVVMPGGGVRMDHARALVEMTGAREVHSSRFLDL
ncbi:MAG: copper homeostasis protein [Planctomycetota bacterium]